MKNFTKLFLMVVSLMLLSNFLWAQTPTISYSGELINYDMPDRGTDDAVILHSQLNGIGTGYASQDFTGALDPADDCQAADDFRIPSGETWYISELTFGGFVWNGPGPFTDINIYFYDNASAAPDNEVASFMNVPVNIPFGGSAVTIDLAAFGGLVLDGNTRYWLSVQGVGEFAVIGQFGWDQNPSPHSQYRESVWENPGDGFGTGATTWTPGSVVFGNDHDYAFELVGYKGLPMAHTPTPADMAIDVAIGNIPLTWMLTPEVDEVQILFGTEYPPVTVLQDWTTPITTINVDVDYNQQYFWQVNTRNAVETTTGDIWGFTTLIQPPSSFTATAGDYDAGGVDNDVLFSWGSSVVSSRALLGYNIFRGTPPGGTEIAHLVPGDSYTVYNEPYNMTATGNEYYAIAVFDEGVSAASNSAFALVNGFGEFNGYVDDFDSGLPLENVTIDIDGVDPQSNPWVYQEMTDATGNYQNTEVIAGTYDITASLWQYYPETVTGVALPYGGIVTQDFTLTPWGPPVCAITPVPADEAQDIDPVELELTWDLDDITVEYRLLFSEEFPPDAANPEDILVDWSPAAESYTFGLTDLQMNTQYFWKVQVRNMWGEVTTCDTWGFTTTIRPPGAFTATQVDDDGDGEYNDVLLEWETSENTRALVGYHLFENGTEIAMVTGTSHIAYNRAYNMTAPGNEYWAVAEFDEGASVESDHDYAYANGFGSVEGYAYEGPATTTPLEGVVVHIEGLDPQLGAWSYGPVTTDGTGYYSIPDVIAGDYDITGTLWQYNDEEVTGVTVSYGLPSTTQDLYLDPWGVPNCVTTPSPFDTEQDVSPVDVTLGWDLTGSLMNEFRIYLDTEYPPLVEVTDGWTARSNHFDVSDLEPNQVYFWQVEVKNMWGETTGCDIWGFTTTINPPGAFTATAFDGDEGGVDNDVRFAWESSVVGRELIGYNIFRNGTEIAHLVPDGGYDVYNEPYNMTAPGNEYWAVAVFDEGVSAESEHDFAYVNGFGEFYGTTYDDDSGDPLAGVTVDLVGEDPQGNPWVYQFTSDLAGEYGSATIIAGDYDFTGSKAQYFDATETNTVGFAGSVQQDLSLVPWGPPTCATDPYPADAQQDIGANNIVLEWTLDSHVMEYRLMFDTEYPPTEVMQDWTAAAEEYALPALDPSLQYFWQIQVRNMWGQVTNCDIWGFTTTITVPEDLTATVQDVNDVLLEWTSSEQQERAFIEYVVYRDAAEIARTTDTEYLDEDLAYNPTPCYSYQVEAIFDEGTSDMSNTAQACITGFGMVDGYVMEALSPNDPIEGATVALDGIGELGDDFTYTFTTDEDGYYSGDVMVGNYDYDVTADDYLPAMWNDDVAYAATTTNDFYLEEYPDTLAYVIATELNDDEAHLEWGFDLATFVPTYFPIDTEGMTDAQIEKNMIVFLRSMGIENATEFTMDAVAEGGERDVESFNVYRGLWDDDFADMTYVGNTTQEQFIDYDWGAQPMGVYKWAVVVVYTNNDSEPVFSNYLDKDMETIVNVDVTLNSAEDPAGTSVTLTNTSEPYLGLVYNTILGSNGMYTFDPFRKGVYDVEVSLSGYSVVYDNAVSIYDETDLSYLLIEIIADPTDFYVNPNGYATWTGTFTPYESFINEGFDSGIPADWTVTITGATGEGWMATDGDYSWWTGSIDGTDFMICDSDYAGSGFTESNVTTQVVNTVGQESLYLEFDEFWNTGWSSDAVGTVSVFDGTTWVDIVNHDYWGGDDGSWASPNHQMIDVSMYANADFQVRFYYAASYDYWYAIDNVVIHNGGERSSSRELQSFKLWLDNVLSGEPTETWWDYEANETLVEGQTYLAEVASVYTTGISNKVPYTFTYYPCTHFDGPTSVTADVVVGTMDVMLTWTPVASNLLPGDDVVGVNVFRDGELIAMVPVGDNFYVDEQLDAADYEYCITNFYESEAQSCQVCDEVTVTPGGYVNGYVTEFATGDPIEGATVALNGSTDSYVFTTDEDGYYEGEVVAGTYDYTASAATYQTEMLEDVLIDFGVTVSQDFELKEFPYPVGEVIATELNDNSVLVNWSGQATGTSEWLIYDADVLGFDGIGAEDAAYSLIWGSKWVPAQLTEYGTGYVTKVSVYQSQPIVDIVTEVRVMSGDGMTVLYSQDITGETVTGQWNIIELDEAVEFDNTENLWIGMYVERPAGGSVNEPTSDVLAVIADRYDYFAYNGADWTSISGEYGIVDQAWMLRGFVSTTPGGKEVALGQGDFNTTDHKDYSNAPSIPSGKGMIASNTPNTRFPLNVNGSEREIVGYNVYVGPCGGDEGDMTFIGFTLDQTFTDNTWAVAEPGIYQWAVETVYDFNASAFAFSNCLDKDMETTVTVEVTTNSGDSPEGTDVVFTNVSEMADPPIVFETELDASGIYTWTDFRKGTYDIYVHLNGFADITVSDVYIWDEAYFEWMLEELLAPPSNLYVTPMGYATWTAGGIVPFEPFLETFNEGLPDTWTVIDGGSTTDTWMWLENDAGNTLDGTPFMMADSDAAGSGSQSDEILISPVIEYTENADAIFIEFDQYYNNLSTTEYADVDVWDGDEWVNVLHQTGADVGSWASPDHQMIDVTEYANPDFQVRFHYYAPGWYWYWAIDNVAVTEGDSKYADRMLEYYKVWHEYTFITDRDTTFYQYGDNGEVLVPGETYMAEVAAVYSTGISGKSFYEWTYYPCDSFPGPVQFFAENIVDTKDVLLTWSASPPPFNGVYEDFEDGMPAEFITDGDRWSVYDGNLTMDGNSVNTYGSAYYDMMFDDFVFEFEINREESTGTIGNTLGCLVRSDGLHGTGTQNGYAFALTQSGSWWYAKYIDGVLSDWTGWLTSTAINTGLGNSNVVSIVANGPSLEYYVNGTLIHSITDADYTEGYCDVFAYDGSAGTNKVNFDYYQIVPGEDAKAVTTIDDVQIPGTGTVDECTTPGVASLGLPAEGVRALLDREDDTVVGANLYRDGEMIAFVEVPDTSYVDMDLMPGYYDYCISFLYESGAYSCLDAMCVEEVLVPEDCDAPVNLIATLDEETYDTIFLEWDGLQEVFITQDPGAPANGYFQSYDYGYGVVYDLSAYPDALAHSIEFHHASWGTFGPFDYNIHIINWDTEETIAVLGPFITTGDDIWEMGVDLEDIDLEGAENVGFLMEPLSNSPTDAYPDLSSDNAANPQGSVYGPLDGPIGASTIGNFLMNIYIMTAFGEKVMPPKAMIFPTAVYAAPRIGEGNPVNETTITQTATLAGSSREWLGYNIYRDGDLIEELWPTNTYADSDGLEAGNVYCYEITSMYSICGESPASNEACAGFVGVPDLDATEANLYPNPARDQITIEAVNMTRLHIVNYVGQVVYDAEFDNTQSRNLNTANYQSGVYVARIYTEAGVITKRFVVNR